MKASGDGGTAAIKPAIRANWQDEIDSAALYRVLAEQEDQPQLAEVYRRLAAVEEKHAGFWEDKLRASGATVPPRRQSWRSRTMAWLARRFGAQFVLPTLTSLESAGQPHLRHAAGSQDARRWRPRNARTSAFCGR